MSRKLFYRRSFLNRPGYHGGAFVLARVEADTQGDGELSIDADIRLSDCYKTVHLDFDAWNRPARRNALHKARLLRDVLAGFCAALEEADAEAGKAAKTKRATKADQS